MASRPTARKDVHIRHGQRLERMWVRVVAANYTQKRAFSNPYGALMLFVVIERLLATNGLPRNLCYDVKPPASVAQW